MGENGRSFSSGGLSGENSSSLLGDIVAVWASNGILVSGGGLSGDRGNWLLREMTVRGATIANGLLKGSLTSVDVDGPS